MPGSDELNLDNANKKKNIELERANEHDYLKKEADKKAKLMLQSISIVPKPADEEKITLQLLKKIPLLQGLLNSAGKTGSALSGLVKVHQLPGSASVSTGFQYAGIALAALDFVRIPAIFFASWILGKRPPIELSQAATWLYSGVVLALLITAVAVPVAAPIIALVTASLGLAMSIYTLGKHFYDRHQVKKSLTKINDQVQSVEKELRAFQLDVRLLDSDSPSYIKNVEKLHLHFEAKKNELQELKDKQLVEEKKLAQMGVGSVADKAISVILGAVALAGLVVSLFFPVVGISIIVGCAITAGAYLVARVGYSLINSVVEKYKTANVSSSSALNDEYNELSSLLGSKKSASPFEKQTPHALKALFTKGIFSAKDEIKALDKHLHSLIENKDKEGIVQFFKDIARQTQEQPLDKKLNVFQIQACLNEFSNIHDAFSILIEAFDTVPLSQEEVGLFSYEPLAAVLKQNGVKNIPVVAKEHSSEPDDDNDNDIVDRLVNKKIQ